MIPDNYIQTVRGVLYNSTLITPLDEGYTQAIKRWNDANEKQAGAVLLAQSEDDVASALKLAVDWGLDVAVRGGGHSHWDASSTEGGVVIDLSRMNQVVVDVDKKTATVQGGALWRDVDEALGSHGLAAVGGTVDHTGVGGLTLGGGYGWLSGKHGLVIDNLISAKMVLADGRIVQTSETSEPDLFWAIRGAGHNFGVAVEFVYQAHDQKEDVFSGSFVFTIDKLAAVVEFLETWVGTQSPNENIFMVIMAMPPTMEHLGIALVPFYNGPEDAARQRFAGLVDIGPIVDSTGMRSYSTVNGILGQNATHGRRKLQKGGVWASPLTLKGLEPVIQAFSSMLKTHPETAGSIILIQHEHSEKIASVPSDAMAFATRGMYCLMMVEIHSDDPGLDGVKAEYAEKIAGLMSEWGAEKVRSEPGTKIYANYAAGTESPSEIYGANLERLAVLKAKYDPKNIFNKYFAIEPASGATS